MIAHSTELVSEEKQEQQWKSIKIMREFPSAGKFGGGIHSSIRLISFTLTDPYFSSEMTYVSGETLNSTHSLASPVTHI